MSNNPQSSHYIFAKHIAMNNYDLEFNTYYSIKFLHVDDKIENCYYKAFSKMDHM